MKLNYIDTYISSFTTGELNVCYWYYLLFRFPDLSVQMETYEGKYGHESFLLFLVCYHLVKPTEFCSYQRQTSKEKNHRVHKSCLIIQTLYVSGAHGHSVTLLILFFISLHVVPIFLWKSLMFLFFILCLWNKAYINLKKLKLDNASSMSAAFIIS